MPKYVIEREVPGAGHLTHDELMAISQISCRVRAKLGCEIQWIESYIFGLTGPDSTPEARNRNEEDHQPWAWYSLCFQHYRWNTDRWANSEIAITAGCLSLRSSEMA